MYPFYETNYEKIRINLTCESFPEHLHSQVELLYVFEGKVGMIVDGVTYQLSAGDMMLCFPGSIHSYLSQADPHVLMVIFSPEVSADFSLRLMQHRPVNPLIRRESMPPDVSLCIEQLALEYSRGRDEAALRGYLQVVLARTMPLIELKDSMPEATDIVHRILQYLSVHFAEPLKLHDLSRALGVSESHLSHTFSRYFHTHFRTYINALRLDHACELLRSTSASITEIIYECGFSSIRTFNRVFLLRYGISPTAYRAGESPMIQFERLPLQ